MRTAIFAACAAAAAAAPFSAGNKLFGTAIKNGPIPPYTSGEWLVYNHSCGAPPCVITQIHVPSIYPGGGSPWAASCTSASSSSATSTSTRGSPSSKEELPSAFAMFNSAGLLVDMYS